MIVSTHIAHSCKNGLDDLTTLLYHQLLLDNYNMRY